MNDGQILISGSSGLIGSAVVAALRARSNTVTRLVRRPAPPGEGAVHWDPRTAGFGDGLAGLPAVDAAIHLSGASVAAHRWTRAYKEEILRSRVETTQALCRLLTGMDQPPTVLVCASAIGIYGNRGDAVVDEDSGAGRGFLADTCRAWEAATREAEEAGIRVVHLRFGIVLTPGGGALAKLLPLFHLGLGGKLGSGRQWMSWISLADAVAVVLRSVDDAALRGPVNVASPGPVSNSEFTATLGRLLGRPAMLGVPAFALRLAVGEMADEALLASCRAVPRKLLDSGFRFEDAELEPALRRLLA